MKDKTAKKLKKELIAICKEHKRYQSHGDVGSEVMVSFNLQMDIRLEHQKTGGKLFQIKRCDRVRIGRPKWTIISFAWPEEAKFWLKTLLTRGDRPETCPHLMKEENL